MRKIIATIAALGFLGTTSLTPVLAASANGTGPSDLSAAKKKKKKAAPKEEKKTELLTTDLSAAKKKKKKAAPKEEKKEEKKSSIILYRVAA